MIEEKSKISVIMSVYNTKQEYLKQAIDSILSQTYTNFELIIVDDGSTVDIKPLVDNYSDERIKYFRKENGGAASARNYGISHSEGEYIAIMDSDDVSHSDRLEKQIKYLENHSNISLVGSWFNILGTSRVTKVPEFVKIMDLLADCCIIHPSVMYRKSDFDKYNLRYDENFICAEDYDLYSRAVKHLSLSNVQESLLDYRVYTNNTSTKKREERIKGSFDVQNMLLNYLSEDKKIREKLLDIAYVKKDKKSKLIENIFSIKNLYKNYAKYKMVTILGLEINFKVRDYNYA